VAEPDERVAAEVGDEEGYVARAQHSRKALAEDIRRGERWRILNGRE
jgi:hypothetical protein